MRKVTGRIGALIVVIALMGSILAGYALNINGQPEVTNEFENVTDVSGLYSYSNEKTYIDYTPASNYIGYSLPQSDSFTINNPNGAMNGLKYQVYKDTPVVGAWQSSPYTGGAFFKNGAVVPNSANGAQIGLGVYRIAVGENFTAYIYQPDGTNPQIEIRIWVNGTLNRYWPNDATFNFNGSNNVAITFNGQTYNTPSTWMLIPSETGDYVVINKGDTGYYQSGQLYKAPDNSFTPVQINEWNGMPAYNLYSITATGTSSMVFVPAVFTYNPVNIGPGVNYTESNRVNNYPIEYEYQENTETQTLPQIDLSNVSATNYFPSTDPTWIIGSLDINRSYSYNGTDYIGWKGIDLYPSSSPLYPLCRYSLSDIVAVMDVPVGTSQIIFDTGDYSGKQISVNSVGSTFNTGRYVPSNFVALVSSTTDYNVPMIDINYGWKAYYTISTGLVDIYTTNGVKISTSTLADTFVQFDKYVRLQGGGGNYYGTTTANVEKNLGRGFNWWATYGDDSNNPYLNATAITMGAVDNTKYLDATKGVKIDPSNTTDVIWNNNYENGNIQLLFRAANTDGVYHNDLDISDNRISIDYGGSRFNATLNDGDAVDIGTWRSIIIDIDLINGDVYAIPVRTFNSYTNVQMDNTGLFIGKMTNYAATNTITWKPAPDSFTFSVYNTSVFMNTYGVVMTDPSLTITNFFTDLDNFYRLELSNFSVYGDSITINDKVGVVTGNRVTFGDESIIVKKLSITYSDGYVFLSDGSTEINLGELTTNYVVLGGAWYFKTYLQKGYTVEKQIYTWNWQDFILDNTEFCIIYIGLVFAALIVARKFCTFSVMDYVVLGLSLIIALSVQVIA